MRLGWSGGHVSVPCSCGRCCRVGVAERVGRLMAYPGADSVRDALRADGWTVSERAVPEWGSVWAGGHVSLFATRGDACVTVDPTPRGWAVDGWDPSFRAHGIVRRVGR